MRSVVIYKGIDEKDEIAFRCSVKDCLDWGGLGICDMCNKSRILDTDDIRALCDSMYLCPELGSKIFCEKCFKEYQKTAKWFEEDTDIVIESIVVLLNNYVRNLSDEDEQLMQKFISSKLETNN